MASASASTHRASKKICIVGFIYAKVRQISVIYEHLILFIIYV